MWEIIVEISKWIGTTFGVILVAFTLGLFITCMMKYIQKE